MIRSLDSLLVYYNDKKVGTLALTSGYLTAFQYDRRWLAEGFSISPFSLPLDERVFLPKDYDPFEGTFGVFADSLPDGWGRLITDRTLRKRGIDPYAVNVLQRLALVGDDGNGALSYLPEINIAEDSKTSSLDELSERISEVLRSEEDIDVDELFVRGGSSGGARPKIDHRIDGEEWIVKFPAAFDPKDIGVQEYEYSLCARKCGIEVPETRLLESRLCDGFFATRRFDRQKGKRIHTVSVSGLLETSHRLPNLDYELLMRLTLELTKDYGEVEQMFRRMCFNVFAHNRDDHSKNFSYIFDEAKQGWKLAPAYDLTYSNSIGGEHATTINGNGKEPGMEDILKVAGAVKLDEKKARDIASDIEEKVQGMLHRWINHGSY